MYTGCIYMMYRQKVQTPGISYQFGVTNDHLPLFCNMSSIILTILCSNIIFCNKPDKILKLLMLQHQKCKYYKRKKCDDGRDDGQKQRTKEET